MCCCCDIHKDNKNTSCHSNLNFEPSVQELTDDQIAKINYEINKVLGREVKT